MARPYWTSKDNPPYTLGSNFVYANQGNWQQGKADPAEPLNEPRYIFVWTLDGQPWYGVVPPTSSPPEVHFQGEGHNVAEVPQGKHHVDFTIYAGTHSVYAGAYDVYEWGTGNILNDEPYTVGLDITVGPPPPSPLDELRAGVVQLEGSWAYRSGRFSNVLAGTRKCRDALTRLGG